jgi:glycosyltransferase involved in cell wall biosynthesis
LSFQFQVSGFSPMRLLYLSPTAAMGGAERVLLDLLAMLRSARPTWTLGLISGNDGPLVDSARALGVQTVVLPFPHDFARLGDAGLVTPGTWAQFARHAVGGSLSTLRYVQRLRAAVTAFGPDVVHSNGIKMHLLGALVRPSRTALVWHFHDYPGARPVTSRLIRTLRTRCRSVIAVSDSVADDVRRQLGEPLDVHTIWNPVDLSRFTPEGPSLDLDALSALPPAPAGVPRIGLMATFARWKGHLLFLDVLRSLAATHPFRAYIVGGPLYETTGSQVSMAEPRAAIERLGLSSSVGLTGFIADAPAALRSLDVVVHASTSPEPFGLVIAEAMATGRAVLVSDTGGVAEFVTPEVTALTYPSGSAAAMTAGLRRLLDNRSLRANLGVAAHDSARRQFHPDRVCRQVLDVYAPLAQKEAA